MALDEKIIKINDVEYLVKYPIGSLILAENELGTPITSIGANPFPKLSDISIILRHGLHHIDTPNTPLSSAEYRAILDTISPTEFSSIANEVMPLVSPPAKEPAGKN